MENKKTHYRDGAVVLYKRGKSSKWQARLKIGVGENGWKRIATGESDIEKASTKACEYYDEVQYRKKFDLSPESKSFSYCAEQAMKEMEIEKKEEKGKAIYGHYIGAIKNYFIPFFKNTPIDQINYKKLMEFNVYRTGKMGKNPSHSTVNTHNAALSRVFKIARLNNWIKDQNIPKFTNTGVTPPPKEIRPYFTDYELKKLLEHLKTWGETGRKQITKDIRTLLYDYVIILFGTGMRPGTEADFIKWNSLEVFKNPKTKTEQLIIRVKGKTGERELIADDSVKNAMNRILNRNPNWDGLSGNEFFSREQYIFALPCNGKIPNDLGRAFKKCLIEAKLLYSDDGKERTLYSLRHTYATRKLINRDISIYELAVQMGTSVAMIEKHYSHVKTKMIADKFNDGSDLIKFFGTIDRESAVKHMKKIGERNAENHSDSK